LKIINILKPAWIVGERSELWLAGGTGTPYKQPWPLFTDHSSKAGWIVRDSV